MAWQGKKKSTLFLYRIDSWRAGDEIRTRECLLGKQVPYHLATPACCPFCPVIIASQRGTVNLSVRPGHRSVRRIHHLPAQAFDIRAQRIGFRKIPGLPGLFASRNQLR